MPKLIVQTGPRSGKEFSFDRSVIIGRGLAADLALDDPEVSRRHALLRWVDGDCFVLDLGSANGTFVNGRRVSTPTRLRDGDQLGLGTLVALYGERAPATAAPATESVRWLDRAEAQPQILLTMSAEDTRVEQFDAQEAAEIVAAMSERLRFLNDLGTISAQAFDESALLAFVLDELFVLMPQADRAFMMLWDSHAGRLVPTAARTRSGRPAEIAVSRTLLDDVISRREAVLAVDMESDERFAKAESIYGIGIRSAICVPMLFDKELFGVIQVDSASRERRFHKADMALLVGIATQVGLALAYARLHARLVERELLERDLMLARKIQQQFLPARTPDVAGCSFAVECRPAVGVGGDFYDFLELADGAVGIVVGDVCGKGVSAALYAAKLTSDLRYQAAGQTDPAAILMRLNRILTTGREEGMFVTVALAVLHPGSGRLVVSSAGHPLPLVRDARGEVVALGRTGDIPLGVRDDARFEQREYQLEAADSVVLYTDGVTEAMNRGQELFGAERLIDAVRRAGRGADSVLGTVLSGLEMFAGGAPQSDDITILCFARDASP